MKKSLLIFVLSLMTSLSVMAQVTTSALTGVVTDAMGEVFGATIQAVHTPSGTHYGTISNEKGAFDIRGMRVGGPYEITVSYVGATTQKFTDVILQLGETYNLNVELTENAELLENVVVLGTASKFAGQVKTGASLSINNASMTALPTANRSLADVAKLSPYAGGSNSFAGGDGRSTNFTIDGANFNNNFGLSSALPGGGNPISIDAIEEVQVVVAPFDVRQTNFIGGGINAITKSGTNTFKGTAYTYYKNENFRGNKIHGEDLGDRAEESLQTYGFTLGGPIIKNKLFFFVNFEHSIAPGTPITFHAKGSNGSGKESACTINDMNTVRDILINKYGYDPGSATDFPADETNTKMLARIDWNINDNHHLSVRYSSTKNTAWNAPNGNSADAGTRDRSTNRVGETSMAFSKSLYSQDNDVTSWAANLNSRFGNNISNELMFTYTSIEDMRGSDSEPFPFIDIMTGADNHHYMSAGYELFTWNNGVKNKIASIKDDFRYIIGNHNLLAGLQYEHQYANNAYMRNGTGYYRFASLQDFIDCKPQGAAVTYGFNGEKNPNAQVTFNQLGYYLQDEWTVTPAFKLTYGVRFDHLMFDNADLATNKAIYALDFNGQRVDTGKWPNSSVQISPRLGFSWDVMGDRSLVVRGGTGLFAGRLPLVFFTNMPTNANMVQNVMRNITGDKLASLIKDGKFLTTVDEMVAALGAPTQLDEKNHAAGSTISGVDPDFKMPQIWKSSLAVDYIVPVSFPFTVSAEYLFNKNVYACYVNNINFNEPTALFKGVDDRPMYNKSSLKYNGSYDVVMLENTSLGHGSVFTLSANMEPVKNLKLMLAYSHTESKEISGMPGSDPYSTWQGTYVVGGANKPSLQRSRYVVPNKLIASANYDIERTGTHLSLFYTGRSASGNSVIYSNDMNGDGIVNDLIYIPNSANELQFTSDEDKNKFWAFVEQDDYLKSHKGEYAEAYADQAPWFNQFDFRLAQDIRFKVGSTSHKFQLSVDVMNIGNMLSSHWGVPEYTGNSTNTISPLTLDKVENGTPVYKFNEKQSAESFVHDKAYSHCWNMQIGLKYFFN